MNEQMKETASLKVRLPGKAKEYCFRLKAEVLEEQRQWLEAKKLGESGAEIREKRDKMRKYLAKKREFLEFLEMDAEQRRRKAEGLVVSKEIVEVLAEVFHGEILDEITLPKPEELTDEYFGRMYPKTQREEDTRRGLISYRPSWWDEKALTNVMGRSTDETWGQGYIRSIRVEADDLYGKIILTESIQRPKNLDQSKQYEVRGGDKTEDPLLPIIEEVFPEKFGSGEISRLSLSWDEITKKLLPAVKAKICEAFQGKGLQIPEFEVILTPALASNIQTTLYHPEESQSSIYEWTSTKFLRQSGDDSGIRLVVGKEYANRGGASCIRCSEINNFGTDIGFRLSIVLGR